jgi:heptosyltransferase-3
MYKSWNIAGFAELIEELQHRGIPCIVVSGPDANERAYVQEIVSRQSQPIVDLSGQLDLSELAALISQARCFIGLDSVATHIAAAVGTPCVALFGPSKEQLWAPWQVPHRLVSSPFNCRPCDMPGCGNSQISDCLQAISAKQVMAAVMDLLGEQH